jgi:hypothetical protein
LLQSRNPDGIKQVLNTNKKFQEIVLCHISIWERDKFSRLPFLVDILAAQYIVRLEELEFAHSIGLIQGEAPFIYIPISMAPLSALEASELP